MTLPQFVISGMETRGQFQRVRRGIVHLTSIHITLESYLPDIVCVQILLRPDPRLESKVNDGKYTRIRFTTVRDLETLE